ncbi:hypothetical protein CES85_5456 [Ochrobactrum quorumnocens]|uniref:Uncharacterized protein n=1 Tax=Ochrobactrum quorumnocens TaxID=271865 RepID=A0A248UE29_9HYPH|nr:hypothetical protein [[Ochrobactrum] quorumnocens]ASV84661.1 hypothetical protein CES85_5456 [[Ochrobactrum] quorumnocens]
MDELRAYNSSLRDWLAQKLMDDARGGSTWGKVVEGATARIRSS